MKSIDDWLKRFSEFAKRPAFIFRDREVFYQEFLEQIHWVQQILSPIPSPSVIAIESFETPMAYAALFAVLKNHIAVPMLPSLTKATRESQRNIAHVEVVLKIDEFDVVVEYGPKKTAHPLLENLKSGVVLFSSGSTSTPKGVVHDFCRLGVKFEKPRPSHRYLQFLLFDHIGGLNTALAALSSGGCLVLTDKKDPASIADQLERHNVEVLPTSPSFLQWLSLSHELDTRNLSSLKMITYGTEPMPSSLLQTWRAKLPRVSFKQTYGLSEIGILATKSRSDDSVWLRLKDEFRIQNGLLELRTSTSMLGYLNAESPFTDDGWFRTKDAVEVDGDWLHILGRQTDLMNVAGLKVSPLEVESVLLQMPEVIDAIVYGEPNPLLGTVVKAQIYLSNPLPLSEFRTRMRLYCEGRLETCKIPQTVELLDSADAFSAIKKLRPRSI